MTEYIKGLIFGSIIAACLFGTAWGCHNFLEHQNLDNYFNSDGVYDFSDEQYLLMEDTELCGINYLAGSIVDKELYNKCINN